MFVRSLRAVVPVFCVVAAAASAQTPRHESKQKIGEATLTVEHGQPPWSDDRLGQMAQIPPGQPWRMGAENMTTLKIEGSPIFFGDKLVLPGKYGFNLGRAGEKDWVFVVFDPSAHESEQNYFTPRGDETLQTIPTTFAADVQPSVAAMTLDVTNGDTGAKCELAWGTMRVSATIAPVRITTANVTINSNEAEASWYARPIPANADLTKPMIAGRVALELDGEDCTMNVYVMMQGDEIVTLFRNVEREQWESELAQMDGRRKQLDAALQQFGAQAEAQIAPMMKELDRRQARDEVMLDETAGRPDNLKFTEKAYDGKGTGFSCEMVKTRGGLKLEVTLGAKTSVVTIDESKFVMKASG